MVRGVVVRSLEWSKGVHGTKPRAKFLGYAGKICTAAALAMLLAFRRSHDRDTYFG